MREGWDWDMVTSGVKVTRAYRRGKADRNSPSARRPQYARGISLIEVPMLGYENTPAALHYSDAHPTRRKRLRAADFRALPRTSAMSTLRVTGLARCRIHHPPCPRPRNAPPMLLAQRVLPRISTATP